jgi:hypothetical protein
MILIFGGAYQGKLSYVLERFKLTDGDVYPCRESTAIPSGKKIIYEIDKWILALIKADMNVEGAVLELARLNPDAVIICNDISCGVVPADMVMRKWREWVGRSLAVLSRGSDEVIRVFCGIGARIK